MNSSAGGFTLSLMLCLGACAPKIPFYFDALPPPSLPRAVPQYLAQLPPFYRPTGHRPTMVPDSQYFTLAILNCVDSSGGRALDLRKSLADVLSTQIYELKRFTLYDRKELGQYDAEWLADGGKDKSAPAAHVAAPDKGDKLAATPAALAAPVAPAAPAQNSSDMVRVASRLEQREQEKGITEKLKKTTDGLLVSNITSRTGTAGGGKFRIEYRIVSTSPDNEIVLFASSKEVRYSTSNADEVDYNREDLKGIARDINAAFPNPNQTVKAQVVAIDGNRLTIDMGKDQNTLPGMRGYVVTVENKVRTSSGGKAEQLSYLAKFQISEVYDKTSTAVVIDAPESYDLRVGDEAILK